MMVVQQIGIADKQTLDAVKNNTERILGAATGSQTIDEYANINRLNYTTPVNAIIPLTTVLEIEGKGVIYSATISQLPTFLNGYRLIITIDDLLIYNVKNTNASSSGSVSLGISSFKSSESTPSLIVPEINTFGIKTTLLPIRFEKLKIQMAKEAAQDSSSNNILTIVYSLEV